MSFQYVSRSGLAGENALNGYESIPSGTDDGMVAGGFNRRMR